MIEEKLTDALNRVLELVEIATDKARAFRDELTSKRVTIAALMVTATQMTPGLSALLSLGLILGLMALANQLAYWKGLEDGADRAERLHRMQEPEDRRAHYADFGQ